MRHKIDIDFVIEDDIGEFISITCFTYFQFIVIFTKHNDFVNVC